MRERCTDDPFINISRQYAELANPLQAITEVNEHFRPYGATVTQIGELSARVTAIHRNLAAQIQADFRVAFGQPTGEASGTATAGNKLTAVQLADACKVLEVLDERVRRDLLKWFIGEHRKRLSDSVRYAIGFCTRTLL